MLVLKKCIDIFYVALQREGKKYFNCLSHQSLFEWLLAYV